MSLRDTYARFADTPFGELVTGRAHRAHPNDVTVPIGQRFAGQTILLVNIALERAAILSVTFDDLGTPSYGQVRHVQHRKGPEFEDTLRREARMYGAKWAMIVFSTSWVVNLARRQSRPGPAEEPLSRWRGPQERPDEYLTKTSQASERVFGAVDHPFLDKSLLFQLSRPELDGVVEDVRKVGLGVAAVRIGVAAQLEVYFATQGEAAAARDVLVTDGLSAVLIAFEGGDFIAVRGQKDATADQPRQTVRPKNLAEDALRFLRDQRGDEAIFVGDEETCDTINRTLRSTSANVALVRHPDQVYHQMLRCVVAPECTHDLNPDLEEQRPAAPKVMRRVVLGYLGLVVLLTLVVAVNMVVWLNRDYGNTIIAQRVEHLEGQVARARSEVETLAGTQRDADGLMEWVAGNYHAQEFLLTFLKAVPAGVMLERVSGTADETSPQLTLHFTLRGEEAAQIEAVRQIERAILGLRCRIGDRSPAAPAGPGGIQYQWKLILPKEEV